MTAFRRISILAAFAILASGCTLLSWGNNGFGQLGDATTTDRSSPTTTIPDLPEWRSISAGDSFTCGTGTDDSLWCWGQNHRGQLGIGTQDGHKWPQLAAPTTSWHTVAAGGAFACGLTTGDGLFCWGDNGRGQLGDGTVVKSLVPQQIGVTGGWVSFATGLDHTCAIDPLDQLWCWGDNDEGQIGNGVTGGTQTTPANVPLSGGWAAVTAGDDLTCALANAGTLWCWGDGDHGKLGQGLGSPASDVPLQVGTESDWQSVSAGYDHVCGLRDSDDLWCWGRSTDGQVGDGTAGADVGSPVAVGTGESWASVELGEAHSCATTVDETVWCWGYSRQGRLGQFPSQPYWATPTQVPIGMRWDRVTAGAEHTCIITTNDRVSCMGHNHVGQLGLGYSGILEYEPITIDPAWISIAGGASHSCRVGSNGTLWCWGRNNVGQLGLGAGVGDALAPVALGIIEWEHVAAGGNTTCAIRAGDHLRCWGAGTFGQIGDGFASDRDSPTDVDPSTGWATVDTSGGHTCAVKTDGTMWCWGRNNRGQVGDGTTTQRNAPTQVGTATDWASVTTGVEFTCALTTSNTRSCWGRNAEGQFGNASTADSLTPTSVAGAWTDIAGGNGHTCGIRTSGTMYCSGLGVFGQLGNGTNGASTVPVQVGTATNWSEIDTGDFHTCGVQTNGLSNTLSCWGANYSGQLGDGTTTDRNTPFLAVSGLVFDVATGSNHSFSVGL